MTKTMIKMICIDVDGTLVGTDNELRPRVKEALFQARDRGIRLVLCTGRPAFGKAFEYASILDPNGWHIFQSGSSVVQLEDGQIKSSLSTPIPTEDVQQLLAAAEEQALLLELYSDSNYASSLHDQWAADHCELLGVPFPPLHTSELDSQEFGGEVVRAQWLLPWPELKRAKQLTPKHLELHPAGGPRMPNTVFVSITAPNISKGNAIKQIAQAYGFGLDEVMMVGDGQNDLSAMRVVGHSVAMGNAEAEVKALAQHVVGHVDDEGLIEAIELAYSL